MDQLIIKDLDEKERRYYDRFFRIYSATNAIHTDILERHELGERNRKCRFCGKSYPDVKFKKEAHVIAQGLGNRFLLNNFECDTCNAWFGRFESDFVNYIDYMRKVAGVENKNQRKQQGTSVTDSPGLTFHINGEVYHIGSEYITSHEIDNESRLARFTIKIKPYRPLHIYKMLLKIALCCVPEDEIDNFKIAIALLQDSSIDPRVKANGYFKVFEASVPGGVHFVKPFGVLYSKLLEAREELYPEKTFCFFFASRVWQIFLPFNTRDKDLVGKKFEVIVSPLPIEKGFVEENGMVSRKIIDLSSEELVRDKSEQIVIQFDSDGLMNEIT